VCRFAMYLGPEVTLSALFVEPSHSLIRQSVHAREREEPVNGDGFGVAWYAPAFSEEPAVFKSISPAWNDRNLLELSRVTASGCVLAHVRAATLALEVSQSNCHPFVEGPYAFMHNGTIGAFPRIRRAMVGVMSDDAFASIRGTTDSEHLFGLVLDRLSGAGDEDAASLVRALHGAVRETIAMLGDLNAEIPSTLNLALSNGTSAVACRYTTDPRKPAESLYVHRGERYVCRGGACWMEGSGDGDGAVLVASERLSDDPGWAVIPEGSLALIDAGHVETIAWDDVA
jgi:glutamine amidotransferase